jgi:hypothetical protein
MSQSKKACHLHFIFFTMQAILQQMIVASPSVNLKSYSSKKEKSGHIKTRKRKSRDEIYVDPKEAEAASTAAKVLEEAFHQLCEMCGHYFQVGAKIIHPKYFKYIPYHLAYTMIVVAVKY